MTDRPCTTAIGRKDEIGSLGNSFNAMLQQLKDLLEQREVQSFPTGKRKDAPTLFQRGFSTRKHKSGGLGLHWCANPMAAMHGALRLKSEGPGSGAVAILTLALAPTVAQTLAA